jgi:hypothetical protein
MPFVLRSALPRWIKIGISVCRTASLGPCGRIRSPSATDDERAIADRRRLTRIVTVVDCSEQGQNSRSLVRHTPSSLSTTLRTSASYPN